MSIKIKNLSRTKISIIIIVILCLALGGYYYYDHSSRKASDSQPVSINHGDGINYSPPSSQEKTQADQNKTKIADQTKEGDTKPNPVPTAPRKAANPIISSWGQSSDKKIISVSGYISDVYEEGGTCTLELVKSGVTVEQSQTARKDAQVTTCGQIKVDRSKLGTGTWTATIIYSSKTAYGKSDPESVTVI